MKKERIWMVLSLGLACGVSQAQFVVSDPGNTVVNSTHSGISTLIKVLQDGSFKSLVKNVEDLKKISSAVSNLDRGVKVIQKATQLAQTLSKISTTVSVDRHISPAEYRLILNDMRTMSVFSGDLLKDMRSATATNMLKMDDNGRIGIIDKVDQRLDQLQGAIGAYFSAIQRVSNQRATSIKDRQLTTQLYTRAATAINGLYGSSQAAVPFYSTGSYAYEKTRAYNDSSVLDTYADSQELANLQKRQEELQYKSMQYSSELQLWESRIKTQATAEMLAPIGPWIPLPKRKKSDPQLYGGPGGQIANEREMELMVEMTARKKMVDSNIIAQLRAKWGIDTAADMSGINTAGRQNGMAQAQYIPPARSSGVSTAGFDVYQPGTFAPAEPDPINISVYIPPVTVVIENPKPPTPVIDPLP